MKVLLVALAFLALAANAASAQTAGSCGCQQPHLPPPTVHVPPPPPQCHYLQPLQPQPQPHPCPSQQPQPSPWPQHPGACGGVGSGTPNLDQCTEFLRHQCSPMSTPSCSPQCQSLRQQCCQQIKQVEPVNRYQAIFNTVLQSLLMQQPQHGNLAALLVPQIAQPLTTMCGV